MNNYPINLLNNKQPFFNSIYSLELIKLEILKTYIKIDLTSSFIRLSKFLFGTSILFVQIKNGSLYLFVDY